MARAKRQRKPTKAYARLDEVDASILALLIAEPGITHEEIGKRLGYQRQSISARANKPTFQAELKKQTDALIHEVVSIVKRAQMKAALKASRLIDSKDEQVAARVSLKILDGIPEVAAGTLKPEADAPGKSLTEDERKALARYLAEGQSEEAEEQATTD